MGLEGTGVAWPPGLAELVAAPGAVEAARAMGAGHRLGVLVGDGPAVTLRTTADGVVADAGVEEARVVIALDEGAWRALLAEELSMFGLLYAGVLKVERGSVGHLGGWEPALQALLYGRPVYDGSVAAALDGTDPARSWTLADDPAQLAAALERHGFLHVRGVFDVDEVAVLSAEVDRLRRAARPDDGRSWWATTAAGDDVCCRLTFTSDRSDALAALADDGRLAGLAALAAADLRPAPDRNDGISVVIKNPEVTAGLSDLPWHRDCGLGGHPLLCPGLNVGVQLDRADAANGQLWFLPGSHHHAGPVGDPWSDGYPVVAIDAEPGDVTVHHGHVLHAAPPPTSPDAGRRAVYVGFSRPELFAAIPPGHAYNDVVFADGDGHIRNIAESPV